MVKKFGYLNLAISIIEILLCYKYLSYSQTLHFGAIEFAALIQLGFVSLISVWSVMIAIRIFIKPNVSNQGRIIFYVWCLIIAFQLIILLAV